MKKALRDEIAAAIASGGWRGNPPVFTFELRGQTMHIVQDMAAECPCEWDNSAWRALLKHFPGGIDDRGGVVNAIVARLGDRWAGLPYRQAKAELFDLWETDIESELLRVSPSARPDWREKLRRDFVENLALDRCDYNTFADLAADTAVDILDGTGDLDTIETAARQAGFEVAREDTRDLAVLVIADEAPVARAGARVMRQWAEGAVWCIASETDSLCGVYSDDWESDEYFLEIVAEVAGI